MAAAADASGAGRSDAAAAAASAACPCPICLESFRDEAYLDACLRKSPTPSSFKDSTLFVNARGLGGQGALCRNWGFGLGADISCISKSPFGISWFEVTPEQTRNASCRFVLLQVHNSVGEDRGEQA
jgi:hypothetical protein